MKSDEKGLRRQRLDLLLVARGLCVSRQEACRLILAGKVRAGEVRADKPGTRVPVETALSVATPEHPFASRGGVKLRHALEAFGLNPQGRVCLDVGASTGGFTDCLLQAGAVRVIAVDVGYGQLAPRLRGDPRVTLLERTNIRHLDGSRLPCRPDLAAVDVSFISLRLVLPVVARLVGPPRDILALVKPQFEVGKGQVGKRGVVRDPALHRCVLEGLAELAGEMGLAVGGLEASPLLGPKGNREFLLYLRSEGAGPDVASLITGVLTSAAA
jgi:23S rRNA (cytidine1920-2'-O)/16S rRNA (cytidine1409-2'-O)-methyltransferase